METETQTETYDNYKFLTKPELKSLSLEHLIGKTNLLRPYMHGYFVAAKLYDQARLIANPYIWEEERAKRIREKVEKERASRIRGTKKVKVNQKLADKILSRQEKREKVDTEAGVLGDSRFGKIFEDEEFKVDETSHEFRALNPSTKVPGFESQDVRIDKDSSDESGESEDETEIRGESRKPKEDVVMQVSSSRVQGGQIKDTAFGSRAQKQSRASRTRTGEIVGEQQVTFVPESKTKGKPQPPPAPAGRREDRRSASTNTFRRI
jgi:ribosome biogenesis protein ENP2